MTEKIPTSNFANIPQSAQEFIKLIIKKMRYRKKVRLEVQQELIAHFEDELRDCIDKQQREQKAKELIEQFGDAKLLGILLRRAKKRCRPLWRTVVVRTFQTIGVLIVCFTIYTVWFLAGKPAVTIDYVAELNRIIMPVADENLNAAHQFIQAITVCPNIPEFKKEFWGKMYNNDANETEKKKISDIISKCSPSLELITEGTQKPYYWLQYKTGKGDDSMMSVLMPYLAEYRNMALILCYRAQILAEQGLYTEAFNDLVTCYNFGRLIGEGEKTLIEQLVGIAIEALAINNIRGILTEYDINPQHLNILQKDFLQVHAGQEFRMRLLFEKLCIYDEIQRSLTDGFGGGHPYPKRLLDLGSMWNDNQREQNMIGYVLAAIIYPKNWDDAARFMFFHPNKEQTKEQADVFYNFIEEIFKLTPAELREKEIDLDKKAESMTKNNILLRMLKPAFGKVHQISYRLKADVQATTVIIAALRFKAENGQYSDSLEQLKTNGYITDIPIDPFSDEPLVYKKTDEGFTLYSFGLNLKDDGGQVSRNKDGKVIMWDEKEGDAVFWPVQK